MTTLKYIQERKFGLLYFCDFSNSNFSLKDVPWFWTDEQGKSYVISARTSSLLFSERNYTYNKIKITNPLHTKSASISGEIGQIELFLWMRSATISDIKKLLKENRDNKSDIKSIYRNYSGHFGGNLECGLFLLDLTDYTHESNADLIINFKCFKLITGGIEIIYKYLTSTFIQEFEKLNYSPYPDYPDCDPFEVLLNMSANVDLTSPYFTFKSHPNFDHLTENKIKYDTDEDGIDYSFDDGAYPYFNLNLDIIEQLNEQLTIPDRIRDLLNDEQINKLPDICRDVVNTNIVRIFEVCLNQRYLIPKITEVSRGGNDTWGLDLYDALGGDGGDSVYLGDGMSINPDGSIDDD